MCPSTGISFSQNILVKQSGELLVLDWEYAREQGFEIFDPVFFILTSMINQDDPVRSFWRNIDGDGPYARLAVRNLGKFGASLGITAKELARWTPYVLLRALVRHSPGGDAWSPFYWVYRSILENWTRPEVGTWLG